MADYPAYAILYGPRALLSFVGIATIIKGVFKSEHTFDELGVKAFENANAAGLEPVAYFDDVSDINKEELDAACPVSWPVFVGWALLGVASLIPHQMGMNFQEFEMTVPGLTGFVCCITIGFILVWPVRESYNERQFRFMVQNYQMASAFAVVLLGSIVVSNLQGPVWMAPLGALCIASAMYRFWKNRKMGESWMRNGRPNWSHVVCNGGGNLFMLGWFLFWLGFSGIDGHDEWTYFHVHTPLYMNVRAILAALGCFIIVALTVVVEHMTDEHDDVLEAPVGRHCGRFTELFLSIGFMVGFGLYGAASYFPSESNMRIIWNTMLTVVLIMQGRAYGLLYQKAIPNHDANRWSRLGRIILCAFGFLVLFQFFTRWASMGITMVGIVLVLLGHRHIMDDRKRGKLFLDTGKPNPAPIVYSFGPILYTLGWILLALAMSIPQQVW
ncbi:expressed unknown protein [Seminavis robusta]|uniref:Uncharacterized protein n=1 Tax=Seminavis robusta TaxID=568900 RepID=A0A9N8HNW3_9STRA|nr:expressed unknown protein [Seminavis robusta]|eukprot:Sro1262_g257130.1 n/a (442) ;mRNA; f:20011-21626